MEFTSEVHTDLANTMCGLIGKHHWCRLLSRKTSQSMRDHILRIQLLMLMPIVSQTSKWLHDDKVTFISHKLKEGINMIATTHFP